MTGARHDHAAELGGGIENLSRTLRAHGWKCGPRHALKTEHVRIKGKLRGFHILHFDRTGNAGPGVVGDDIDYAARDPLRLGDVRCDLFVGRKSASGRGRLCIVAMAPASKRV